MAKTKRIDHSQLRFVRAVAIKERTGPGTEFINNVENDASFAAYFGQGHFQPVTGLPEGDYEGAKRYWGIDYTAGSNEFYSEEVSPDHLYPEGVDLSGNYAEEGRSGEYYPEAEGSGEYYPEAESSGEYYPEAESSGDYYLEAESPGDYYPEAESSGDYYLEAEDPSDYYSAEGDPNNNYSVEEDPDGYDRETGGVSEQGRQVQMERAPDDIFDSLKKLDFETTPDFTQYRYWNADLELENREKEKAIKEKDEQIDLLREQLKRLKNRE